MGQYYTKTELTERWSNSLIEKYIPHCSLEKPNPRHKNGAPMQLYDKGKVRYIESTEAFKADFQKVIIRKIAARERAEKKCEKLKLYVNSVQIKIPTMDKDKLIRNACHHYNSWREWKEGGWDGEWRASPSSDESFLKRITLNYLRHQCTCYEDELDKFRMKVGKQEAHDILQKRINDAIKQKYEWLK